MNARVRLNEYFPKKDFFYACVCVLIKKYKGENLCMFLCTLLINQLRKIKRKTSSINN